MSESVRMVEETRQEVAFCAQALRHRLASHRWATDKVSQEEARRWLAQSAVRFDALPAVTGVDPLSSFYLQAHLCAAHVLIRLAVRNPQAEPLRDFHGYLARQEKFAELHGLVGWLLQIWVAQALLHRVEGRAEDARRMIGSALVAAAPRGYFRIFLDEGDLLRPPLESAELRLHDNDLGV